MSDPKFVLSKKKLMEQVTILKELGLHICYSYKTNRIVGDTKLPKNRRYTNTNIVSPKSWEPLWKDAPLLDSGLLGPVRVLTAKKLKLEI